MANVIATYTKKLPAAKASVRYIGHRPGKDGARANRELFGKEGTTTRQEAYQKMDAATRVKRCTFYRIVISPDPKTEDNQRDLNLRKITEQTMQTLEAKVQTPIYWVAAAHDDHAPHRHVHVVAVIQRTLKAPELLALRQSATQECIRQQQERMQESRGEEQDLELVRQR